MKGYIDDDGYIRIKTDEHYRRRACIYDSKRMCNNTCIGFGEVKMRTKTCGPEEPLQVGPETFKFFLRICDLTLRFEEFIDPFEKDSNAKKEECPSMEGMIKAIYKHTIKKDWER